MAPPQAEQQQPDNREDEIMGAHDLVQISEGSDDDGYERIMGQPRPRADLGEGMASSGNELGESTAEPFDAVHIAGAGDIEDHDQHFVMTDDLRHKELKNAVLNHPEASEEASSDKLARQMEYERAKILEFQRRQIIKDKSDAAHLEVEDELGEALEKHHLQRDAEGRIVPNF